MKKNQLCHHHAECGKKAAHTLDLSNGETIHVCEDCDANYGGCEVCDKCASDNDVSKHPDYDFPICNICSERLHKELGLKLKKDVEQYVIMIMPSYHESVKEWFLEDIVADVKLTSEFEDEYCYSESDISIAFQRVILEMIETLDATRSHES